MKLRVFVALTVSLAASQAWTFHADIFLTQQSGKLITGRGAADPGSGGNPVPGVRFHINDIAGLVPFVDSNPGFSAAAATDSFFLDDTYQPLPGNRTLGFNLRAFRIQNGSAANLFYWDGTGGVSFQPVTNVNDYLEVRSGTNSAIATGAAADVLGFGFTATDPQGALHSHLTFDFDVDNNSATSGSSGMFLAAFELSMDLAGDTAREVSRPHYVAWFNGPPGALKSNATTATETFLIDEFAGLRLMGDVSPLGNDNLPDDLVDATDIDALLVAINSDSTDSLFDLNSDTTINTSDTEILLDILGTQFGDANLDGLVNGADLAVWQANYGTSGGWAAGNFNGDSTINGRDFLIWQRNVGFGASEVAHVRIVPEPSSMILLTIFLTAVWGHLARGRGDAIRS